MVKFLNEGIAEDPASWLPALPSRLTGQLEAHQASRLLHGALPLAVEFLMKGYVLSDATQEAEVGGRLEVKFVLGSAQLLTGDPMCSESLNEVPVGCCVAIGSPGGRVQVAQLPQEASQSARRGPQGRHFPVLGEPDR